MSADDAPAGRADISFMNEVSVRSIRTVDRAATIGIFLTLTAATAFVALDSVRTVTPRAQEVVTRVAVPVPQTEAVAASPLTRLALPTPTGSIVTDGRWAAYTRLAKGDASEIVVRSLTNDDWYVAYHAPEQTFVGQLSLAQGLLVFEEVTAAQNGHVVVRALDLATGTRRVIDEYTRLGVSFGEGGGFYSTLPLTDGQRVFWVHQTAMANGGVCDEIRALDLASGKSTLVFQRMAPVTVLAVSGDTLAFSLAQSSGLTTSFVADLRSGAVSEIDGFAFSQVQSVGPQGVILVGATDAVANAPETWLVGANGTRDRLGSDCYSVAMTARLLAVRCNTAIEIDDLVTGGTFYVLAPNAGQLAVFADGALWTENDELVVYMLPELPRSRNLT